MKAKTTGFIILAMVVALTMAACTSKMPAADDAEQPGQGSEAIAEAVPEPEPSGQENQLSFDSEKLGLGETYGEIEADFPGLEYVGYWNGGSYFSSPESDWFFIFGEENPEYGAKPNAVTAPAKDIFPSMGEHISPEEIEGMSKWIVNIWDSIESDGFTVFLDFEGWTFWYESADQEGVLFADSLVTVMAAG